MMTSKLLMRITLMMGLTLCLSACWDNRPINDRMLVLSMGFDPAHKAHQYQVTFQAPTPSATASSDSGGGSSGSSGMEVFDVKGTGPDLAATFSEAQAQVSKDLFLGQLILVAISTKLPPGELASIMNSLTRIGTLDKTPFVIATNQSATQVLEHTSPQARFPCFYFLTLFSCTTCQTDSLGVRLWQFLSREATPGVDAFLPVVSTAPQGFTTDTVALYRKYRYVTTLSPKETQIFGILEGISHKANFYFPRWQADIRAVSGGSHLSTTVIHGQVHATINLRLTATLASIGSVTENAQELSMVAQAASKRITDDARRLIQKTQALDVDPLGIGRMLSWQHPRSYTQYLPWHQEYPKVDVTVHCTVTINKMGDLK